MTFQKIVIMALALPLCELGQVIWPSQSLRFGGFFKYKMKKVILIPLILYLKIICQPKNC